MAAGGLYARFDCGMPRDPKMSRAGALARLIYMEAVMYSKENMTDGLIERVALAHFTVDVDQKTKTKELNRLAKLGALENVPLGWKIPEEVWRRWNPLKVEVDAKRAAAAEKKAQYRAAKKAGTTESVHDVSPSDTLGTRQVVQGLSSTPEPEPVPVPKTEPVPVPEPSPEPEIPSTSSKLTLVATPPPEEEEGEGEVAFDRLIDETIHHATELRLARAKKRPEGIGNPTRYRAVLRDQAHQDLPEIRSSLAKGLTPTEAAHLLVYGTTGKAEAF